MQVFWGDGKGKTTAALGTALRACGNGYKVHLVQFMKNGTGDKRLDFPGEIKALKKFDNFSYERFGVGGWVFAKDDEHKAEVKKALEHLKDSFNKGLDILIGDEILYAVQLGIISEDDVLDLISEKPEGVELILTGSHRPLSRVFEKADLVTGMKKIKHPFDKGVLAREGIEY